MIPILVGGASRAAPPRRAIVLGIAVGALNMKVSAAFPSEGPRSAGVYMVY